MAWNPTPEVAVARDAHKAIQDVLGEPIDKCILIYSTDSHALGYASYGRNSALCGQARRMADIAYVAIRERHDNMVEAHMARRVSNGNNIDWNGLLSDVSLRLNLLRASLQAENVDDGARRMMMRDLVVPAIELLGRFCACVNIEEAQNV